MQFTFLSRKPCSEKHSTSLPFILLPECTLQMKAYFVIKISKNFNTQFMYATLNQKILNAFRRIFICSDSDKQNSLGSIYIPCSVPKHLHAVVLYNQPRWKYVNVNNFLTTSFWIIIFAANARRKWNRKVKMI